MKIVGIETRVRRMASVCIVVFSMSQPAVADDRYAVSQAEFDCLINNAAKYLEQGEEVFVNFSICPAPPGVRDRLASRNATNWLTAPSRNIAASDRAVPDRINLLLLSPERLLCLMANRREVDRTDDGLVVLFPEVCP